MPALSLHRIVHGESGDWIILLHGLFGSGDNLNTLARSLSDRYRVVLADLRNHGRSPRSAQMSLQLMADDVACLQDELGIDSCALLGHSLGGKVAMQLALQRSERVRRLVVADIAPVAYEPHHDAVFAALRGIDLDALQSRQQAGAVLAQHLTDTGLQQFLLKGLYKDGDRYRWRFNLAVLMAQYDALLAAPAGQPFEGPTLFIKGGRSEYIRAEYEAAIRRLFPHFEFRMIAAAGHWLHGEKPAAFNRLVAQFLQES